MSKETCLNGSIGQGDKNILRKYLEIAGVIFVVLDRAGNVVSMNQELANILKMEVGDIRGKNWFENFIAHKDKQFVKEIFSSLMEGKITSKNEVVENSIIDKNGNERVILWHNAFIDDKDGEIYGTISSGMDITDKLRIQEEQSLIIGILKLLNRSDSKVDLIAEILRYIKNHSGFESVGIRLREGNDYPYYHSLGFSDEFLISEKSLCPQYEGDCLDGVCDRCMCGAVIHGKTSKIDDKTFSTKRGTFWANDLDEVVKSAPEWIDVIGQTRNRCYMEGYKSMALIPIQVSDEIIGLLHLGSKKRGMFSSSDIRFYENLVESVGIAIQRITVEEDMRNAKLRVEETNAKLEEFAYKASHDLREPLRTVTSYAERLEDDLAEKISENQLEYLDKILSGVRLLDKFINDLLSYSRIQGITEKEDVDLQEICKNTEDVLASLIKEKKATIIYGNLPIIKANKLLIKQLMQNLISNALKYSDSHRLPVVIISAKEVLGNWEVSVQDNGIGIADDDKYSVFEMFSRIVPNEYGGTGMGLAICKKIVEALGGKIWMDSKLGEGSKFSFTVAK